MGARYTRTQKAPRGSFAPLAPRSPCTGSQPGGASLDGFLLSWPPRPPPPLFLKGPHWQPALKLESPAEDKAVGGGPNGAPSRASPPAAAKAGASSSGANASAAAPGGAPSPAAGTVPAAPRGIDVATGAFKAGIGSFQGLIDDLVASVDREREELQRSREQLEEEKGQFEEEKARVNQVLNDSEQVGEGREGGAAHGRTHGAGA